MNISAPSNNDIYQLLYLSSACAHFDQGALLNMLTKAREKNHSLGITGLLLHNNGNFLQLIEGPEENIHTLFDSIRQDTRHQDIIILFQETTHVRLFTEWSMGLREISDEELKSIPGLSSYFEAKTGYINSEESSNRALQLITMFKNNNH